MNSYMKYHWPKDELHIRFVIEEKPEIVPTRVGNVKTDPPSLEWSQPNWFEAVV